MDQDWLASLIRDVPDFPQPGVVFKDITPLLADPRALETMFAEFEARHAGYDVDLVVGIESRGFILAAPIADRLGAGLVVVRKPGKLPWEIEREEYDLEYGTDALEIHRDAIPAGSRVLVVDDVLATGGTAAASVRLIERLGGLVVACTFLIELCFLGGRARLGERPVSSLLEYR